MTGEISRIQPHVDFLYTNIGRGHPFYLDGIMEVLSQRGGVKMLRRDVDVFELSHGFSRLAWSLARTLYRRGSSGGLIGRLYDNLRRHSDYNRHTLMLRLMARDLRRHFGKSDRTVIVAHPLLVASLRGFVRIVYQHGEHAVPGEALVNGADKILVPTAAAANAFLKFGYDPGNIIVTGLCIEPAIARQAAVACESRCRRYEQRLPLTGAFYSSGAEPRKHIEAISRAAISAVREGGRALVFMRKGGELESLMNKMFQSADLPLDNIDKLNTLSPVHSAAVAVTSPDRREEYRMSARLFAEFDYLVAPSHERTNWALGLGLPIYIVGPPIGSFAPLNRDILLQSGTAVHLPMPSDSFGTVLGTDARNGELIRRAEAGREKYPIDGFTQIADFLLEYCSGGQPEGRFDLEP